MRIHSVGDFKIWLKAENFGYLGPDIYVLKPVCTRRLILLEIRVSSLLNNFYHGHDLSYPLQTLFVMGILFSHCPCVHPSVTFCFLNILKGHCWIFFKPCKHAHICKTNTLDKKVRARGQFY